MLIFLEVDIVGTYWVLESHTSDKSILIETVDISAPIDNTSNIMIMIICNLSCLRSVNIIKAGRYYVDHPFIIFEMNVY